MIAALFVVAFFGAVQPKTDIAAFGKFMVNGPNFLTSDISVVLTADDGVTLLTPG